jgi:hypothetical protein
MAPSTDTRPPGQKVDGLPWGRAWYGRVVARSKKLPVIAGTLAGRAVVAMASMLFAAAACRGGPSAALTDLAEARQEAADLRVQFNKASDASNRAVMADTDEQSVAFAHEAEQTKAAVQTDIAALAPRLRNLGDAAEIQLLEGFEGHLAEYDAIDRDILALAVENTNLKAQRLSFGPAREAADAFRDALAPLAEHALPKQRCQVESIVARAVLAVRDIQVLQAPHIAEPDDAVMGRMEQQMTALGATARDAVSALPDLVEADVRPIVATAVEALDRFDGTSKEIVTLSRHNSNVRSLELALRRKPAVAAACDDSLHALQDALAKEASKATR